MSGFSGHLWMSRAPEVSQGGVSRGVSGVSRCLSGCFGMTLGVFGGVSRPLGGVSRPLGASRGESECLGA